jgi:succinyl-CoA synthetase alpha subunit
MSILIDENTKVLIQGITGSFGARHAKLSLEYGTKVVAGVTPGKGGQMFETIRADLRHRRRGRAETGATASAIFVPPPSPRMPSSKPRMPAWNSSSASPRASRSWT